MKILFFSDIHGVPATLQKTLEHAQKLQPDKLVLLGDALYHGPRNGVPGQYDPVKVAEILNHERQRIVAVRGNCDSEVDQMMLQFPIMADFAEIITPRVRFFLTHGHLWNEKHLPPVPDNTILAHGHTHVPTIKRLECGISIFNPGSISLPKNGHPATFGWFDGEKLSVRTLDNGEVYNGLIS